jgi:hypothetical protein
MLLHNVLRILAADDCQIVTGRDRFRLRGAAGNPRACVLVGLPGRRGQRPAGTAGVGAAGRVGEDGRMGVIRFTARRQPRGPAAAVVLDDAQVADVGEGARRFPVVATVNGYTCRTSVARMGRVPARPEPGGAPGSLVTYGDLKTASDPPANNELVVDGRGNAYVNGGGFNMMAGEEFAPGVIALVAPDGSVRQVAVRA